jgi:hypothetical protein
MTIKEKKKKLTLKNFTGSAPSSVNKTQAQKTSAIFGKKKIRNLSRQLLLQQIQKQKQL